ncbi:MAG: FTR1 family protein [Gammaproteobacteria bacterium]|nr:FTR1 family protein [Gammaproteobacteria bacterium]
MRGLVWAVVGLLGIIGPSYADVQDTGAHLLHTLDYLRVDYPSTVKDGKVINAEEYHEQLEFATEASKLLQQLPPAATTPALTTMANALNEAIQQRRTGAEVARIASQLAQQVSSQYAIVITPTQSPDLAVGARLFAENCVACHGATGMGDGPRAAELSPKPANFHASDRQSQRDIYSLFSTISLGVAETAMVGFTQFNREQRWSLAFYVSNFLFSDSQRQRGAEMWKNPELQKAFSSLGQLTSATPAEIQQRFGNDGLAVLAYLRAHPEIIQAPKSASHLAFARQHLQMALAAAKQDQYESGYQHAATAYLEGFEMVESALNAQDHALKSDIEKEMTIVRGMFQNRSASTAIESRVLALDALLSQADALLSEEKGSAWVNASGAFIILLREGLEAILVLAAIFAYLSKSAQPSSTRRYIHAGWIAALLLGVVTWWVAARFIVITGENREVMEGSIGLIAAAMLIYVGYWLHNQTHTQQWQTYIRDKLSATGSGTWTLISVSFLAVYREVFETVLFYETMWLQADAQNQSYIILGFILAAGVLSILGWAMFRFSVRLPLRLFFNVNSALLYALAVVLAGKGVAALQAAGTLPTHSVNLPAIDLLGLYPTLQGLLLQLSLILLAVIWLATNKIRQRASV